MDSDRLWQIFFLPVRQVYKSVWAWTLFKYCSYPDSTETVCLTDILARSAGFQGRDGHPWISSKDKYSTKHR